MKNVRFGRFIVFLIAVSFCASCATGIHLSTTGTQGAEIKGDYRVIFFGCNYLNDLETIVFLDKEDDQYTFEPYAPDFRYRVEKRVDVKDAFKKAQEFLNCSASFSYSRMRTVKAPNGDIIGYEIRPIYDRLTYGVDEALDVDYWLRGDRVVIMIRLNSSLERMLQDGGGRDKQE